MENKASKLKIKWQELITTNTVKTNHINTRKNVKKKLL
jgi:hypothetical protein